MTLATSIPSKLLRVQSHEDEGLVRAQPNDGLLSLLKLEELLLKQKTGKFCREVPARQSTTICSKSVVDPSEGLPRRRPSKLPDKFQIVLLASLRPRLLAIAHSARLAGHRGQKKNVPHGVEHLLLTADGCRYSRSSS